MHTDFLDRLNQGEPMIGMFCALGGITAVECIALGGMDFVVIDSEHSPCDAQTALPSIIAAENRNIAPIVRVKDSSRSSILKMLDIGAAGVIVPFIHSKDEVLRLIEYAKFVPTGLRGYGINRSNAYGSPIYADADAYFKASNENTLLLPQCETAGCLHDIEAIAEMEGVDGIFVGPYDLSVALGIPGRMDDEIMYAALTRILRSCINADKYAFIFAGTPEIAKRYLAMGYDAVAVSLDSTVLVNAVRDILSKSRG